MKTLLQITTLATLIFSSSVTAEIYKWRDENGKLHFSKTPRVLSSDVEKIDIKVPEADRNNAYRQKYNLRRQANEIDRHNRKKEYKLKEQERQIAREEREEKARKNDCRKYTAAYEKYRSNGVKETNPFTGDKVSFDEDTERKLLRSIKSKRDEHCN